MRLWRRGGAFLVILILVGWTKGQGQKKHAEKIAEKLKKQKFSTEKPKLLTGKKSQRQLIFLWWSLSEMIMIGVISDNDKGSFYPVN